MGDRTDMASFEETLRALAGHQRLQPNQITQLSGLASEQMRQLRETWASLSDPERMTLLAGLRRRAEEDTLVDFDRIYEMAMDDPNADVRRVAISGIIDDLSASALEKLLRLCALDSDEVVRAAAAERLGDFAYQAEVGGFSEERAREIERVLLERAQSETEATVVRVAALTSAGYLSTEPVRDEIERAITRAPFRIAAIRAIARNIDPVWAPVLAQQMGSEDPAIRLEAAEAASEYEEAVEALSDLVDDLVRAVRLTAIASLGKIGTPEARDTLIYCYESADSEIREAAAEAMRVADEAEDPLGSLGRDLSDGEDAYR